MLVRPNIACSKYAHRSIAESKDAKGSQGLKIVYFDAESCYTP
jgi:hypothetical protein